MCDNCGCSPPDIALFIGTPDLTNQKKDARHGAKRVLTIKRDILVDNNRLAADNRAYFKSHHIFTLNLVSSPGSGKTTVLEQTLMALKNKLPMAVIEGDQQTTLDAERINATGAIVVQVNTGAGCHLDASMIHRACHQLDLQNNSLLFIENVGNLVCPAMFDLGENGKVVIISVTEGEDKPLKYPAMFEAATICLINKIDLLPYVNFNLSRCREYARRVNHDLTFFEISATTGDGMESWFDWLASQMKAAQRV